MLVRYEEGLKDFVRNTTTTKYEKFNGSDKKSVTSVAKDITHVVFKDEDGTYPTGKIVTSDKFVDSYKYEFDKDEIGNVNNCRVIKTSKKNGKSLDIEKIETIEYYDVLGRLIREEDKTRDGVTFRTTLYDYTVDNKVSKKTVKGTHTITYTKFYKDEVSSIVDKTIESKMQHVKYRADFDAFGNIIKIYDGDRHIEKDYERDLDTNGKTLSETIRFFDVSSPDKKLISYITTAYNPAADYKISEVIKNGILTERYTYDLNGDEISMMLDNGKIETFRRTERTVDSDTGDITEISKLIIIDKKTQNVIKDKVVQNVFDKDKKKILSYSDSENNIVTTYEYDDNDRRLSAITKQSFDGELKTISEIKYEYTDDEDNNTHTRKRTDIRYDAAGNITAKTIHYEEDTENTEVLQFDEYTYEKTK